MENKTLMWIVIAVLLLAAVFLAVKANNISAVQTAGNAVQSASSGMVGGC